MPDLCPGEYPPAVRRPDHLQLRPDQRDLLRHQDAGEQRTDMKAQGDLGHDDDPAPDAVDHRDPIRPNLDRVGATIPDEAARAERNLAGPPASTHPPPPNARDTLPLDVFRARAPTPP